MTEPSGSRRDALAAVMPARPGRAALLLAQRPDLWASVVRLGWRMAPPRWWRRWPLVPTPPPDYLAFRMETMLGGSGSARLEPEAVIAYLEWCRRMRAVGG